MNGVFPTAWPTPPSRWASCCNASLVVPDAVPRPSRLLRRAGTHSSVGPGSAQRHFAPQCARDKRVTMSKSFRTLDDVDVKAKRVLLRVDLNVPMENGRVTDATRLERVAPTITEISDKGGKVILLAHFGRPKGRDAKDSLKPVAEALVEGNQEAGRLRRRLHRRGRGQGRGCDEGRRRPLPGEHPLPQRGRKERSGVRRRTRKARRHLGQRRLLGRAPRACHDRRPRPQAARLCRPHHAGRTRRTRQGAGSADQAGHRDHRRRQGLDQDRPAWKTSCQKSMRS